MPAQGVHRITAEFEAELCRYTGAPFALAVDNCSNALWLALSHEDVRGKRIWLPRHTYPAVPCEVILAGGLVEWEHYERDGDRLTGAYRLHPTRVWDAALSFTQNMYEAGSLMCLSFTGPHKHLKLGKGGAILLDNPSAYEWLKRARNSGRGECSYHDDTFTMIGRNCYMMPEIAARGLLLLQQFYNLDGTPRTNPDITLPYPDLSRFTCYTTCKGMNP